MTENKHVLPLLFLAALFCACFFSKYGFGATVVIKAEPYIRFMVGSTPLPARYQNGFYELDLPEESTFPLTLKAIGPFGGFVHKTIKLPSRSENLTIETGIVTSKESNPSDLSILPALCPRLEPPSFIYNSSKDHFNHVPLFQLMDPDAKSAGQQKSYAEMDGKNVLLLTNVRLRYDYEDSAIVDYDGPDPKTGKHQIINEGDGGFYANIHYAVVPWSRKIVEMDRQALLHLSQGKLGDIGMEKHKPELRVHSFVPGPFLSRKDKLYNLCEWGDTAHQAPDQRLEYTDMAVWDWDYSVKNAGHIVIIVWEGDEEDWLIQRKLIHPFYLTDDLIGVFEIKKEDAKRPLTLKNKSGDFEMTVVTGNLKTPPR